MYYLWKTFSAVKHRFVEDYLTSNTLHQKISFESNRTYILISQLRTEMYLMKNTNKNAILVLGIIVISVYFPVTILGHSYNPSLNHESFPFMDFVRDYSCKTNCSGPFYNTIDPAADGDQTWPLIQLSASLYTKGILPLWNPYLAGGTPLAADSTNYVFSPLMVFYLLPNSFWDIPLLISVWLAGVFTYFLLRSWKLQFLSSILGSTIFMLSGTFSWYLPHNSILVVMLAPLVLFSIERTIHSKNFKYVIIGSVALASSILGAHLESIVLLILLAILYSIFRILHITMSKSTMNGYHDKTQSVTLIYNKKNIILRIFLIFSLGIGMSSFFIFPAAEYLSVGVVSNQQVGVNAIPYFAGLTNFVPYLLGPSLHTYMMPHASIGNSWDYLGGYVPSSCIILSIIGIVFSNKSPEAIWQRRIAQFFFGVSVLFMLKSIGIPIVNLIGSLPILEHIIFPRYDSFIWTLGFAIAAAFGIEVFHHRKISLKHLSTVTIISFLVIVLMILLLIPYFSWENPGGYYTIMIILQSMFFILTSYFLIISYQRDGHAISRIFFLILLELSLYIPLGLSLLSSFYRSLAVIIGSIALSIIGFLHIKNNNEFTMKHNTKLKLILIIICVTVLAEVFVYVESPMGLKTRTDEYQSTPVTEFLKGNIGYHRIYSFDYSFVPNYPAVYHISTLGLMSAQSVKWYNSFYHDILDPYSISTNYDYYGNWRQANAPSLNDVYVKNKNYYDFLGVKYIISHQTIPNQPPTSIRGNNWYVIGSNANSLTQTFVSRLNNITDISIQLGTAGKTNPGRVYLTIDSVPYDQEYHRASKLNANEIANDEFNFFKFEPLLNTKTKEFSISLTYPEANQNNVVAVAVYDMNNNTDYDTLSKRQLYSNGNPTTKSMAFSIFSLEKSPSVFHYGDFNIYENKDTFPRVFFVNNFMMANSYESAQKIIKDTNFDLRHQVVLEGSLPLVQSDSLKSSTLDKNSDAKITSYDPNKVVIHTQNSGASLLVFTDTYYPGWKAYVDGKETPVYRADGLVRAIFLPSGNHIIEFTYLPQSFILGATISLSTIVIILGMTAYSKHNRKTILKK